jgi:hypothetical protein
MLQFPGDSPFNDLQAGWSARPSEEARDIKADTDFARDIDYNIGLTRNVCTRLLGPTAVVDDKTEDFLARKNHLTSFCF